MEPLSGLLSGSLNINVAIDNCQESQTSQFPGRLHSFREKTATYCSCQDAGPSEPRLDMGKMITPVPSAQN